MRVIAYTDGACSSNGRKQAQAAWACWFPGHPDWSRAGRVEGDAQTNNRGELGGILEAYRSVQTALGEGTRDIDMMIYTDSEYSKNCLTRWVPGWIRKGWKTATGGPVQNRDLIESILQIQTSFKSSTFEYVKAHTGGSDEHSKHNDRVDRMARGVLDPSVNPTEPPPAAQSVLGDCPLQRMGPPVGVHALAQWARAHLDQLDSDALNKALLKALSETFHHQGLKMEVRKGMASLTSGLQVESGVTIKKEE